MELKMQPYSVPQKVSFNYAELKAALVEKAETYARMVYTEDQIAAAKADRANLNRLKKALNDERIKQERAYMQPFSEFKHQIAEIISIIDKPVQAIDAQVKEFEEQKKTDKRAAICEIWMHTDAPKWLHVIKDKWLNASTPMKAIEEEIGAIIAQAEKDLAVIRALPEYAFEAEQVYMCEKDLAEAVSTAHRLKEIEEKKAAYNAQVEKLIAERNAEQTAKIEPMREWITFEALLSPDEAKALGEFMREKEIQYRAI